MLPSTGYFKGINCPFYDSGLCERPYCHFRHVKKEPQNVSNDGIESGAILQKLVSAAVQKVLRQTDNKASISETLKVDTSTDVNKTVTPTISKVTYNPTPISELKKINNVDSENADNINEQRKRHIPVPYTPRKPTSIPIKRPVDTNGESKPFIYIPPPVKYTPGCTESVQLDPYTPKGAVESTEKYLPGSEAELQEYKPDNSQQTSSKHNYVPSDKSISKKKVLEYKPTKVSSKKETSTITYQPTPRSLAPCFSSDEEEPDSKKRKLSNDLNGFDDMGPEFDILDQILDEEKPLPDEDTKTNNELLDDNNKLNKESKKVSKSENRKDKSTKHDSKYDKTKIDKKKESSKHDKDKSKLRSDDKKSSSSRESSKSSRDHKTKDHKSHDAKKDKHSSDKKKHSSSKHSSDSSSKSSKHSSSRSSEKHSSSRSSRKDSKHKEKSNRHKSHKSSKDSKDRNKDKKSKNKDDSKINGVDDSDHVDNESVDLNNEDLYELSESDEESRTLECKRIFEEYVPTEKIQLAEEPQKSEDVNEDEYVPGKKRISRTAEKNIKIVQKPPIKPDYKVSAAQAMAERLAKVKEYHASKMKPEPQIEENKVDPRKIVTGTPNSGGSKIRIAHVPYASTLMNAKKNIAPNTIGKSEPSTSSTIAQTVKKGVQRVSHVPNEKFIDRPGVLEPLGSKIPANIRSTYLNMMIDQCLNIYLSATDAYARAQHEELTTSKKCSTVPIYKNSAVLAISRLKKELQECNGVKKVGSDCSTLKKLPQSMSGNANNTGTWSIENKYKRAFDNPQEYSGAKLFSNIQKWVLTEEQLKENGFPRPHPSGDKGRAIIHGQNKQTPPKGHIRTCCRCKKEYTVNKKGFPSIKEECIYHPNRKYRVRGEVRYQCCSQDSFSDGCCVAPYHVYEYVDFENLKGYVRTMPPEKNMDDYGVYSLDCEMCYTTHGLDLTRVTVIDSKCKVIFETLVKPLHPIVDYNTRYSGITEEQMAEVRTTLLEVQATLLAMFNSKTILIGHSLESDFKALKLIHDTVIDTSVLFPHKMGPPFKRALRNLSSEHLKKIIQNSVEGHDSAEDATVCMELIHFKLKEDLKTR